MRRRVVENYEDARKIREAFYDQPVRNKAKMPFTWPSDVCLAGRTLAVMYTSDKWKDDGDFEDYKHIAEAPQDLILPARFPIRMSGRAVGGQRIPIELLSPMPKHFAVLAPLLGVQVELFADELTRAGDPKLSGQPLELTYRRALLGGTRHPVTREAFLLIYVESSSGVCAIVTGKKLDVERDGITG